MFRSKAPERVVIRHTYDLPIVCNSEIDLALVREIAFLEGVLISYPLEKKVIGQHRIESNGQVVGVVPVYEDLPVPIGAAILSTREELGGVARFTAIRNAVDEKKLPVRWGNIIEHVTEGVGLSGSTYSGAIDYSRQSTRSRVL